MTISRDTGAALYRCRGLLLLCAARGGAFPGAASLLLISLIAEAGFHLPPRRAFTIGGQSFSDVVRFLEFSARTPLHKPLVAAGIDQFSFATASFFCRHSQLLLFCSDVLRHPRRLEE